MHNTKLVVYLRLINFITNCHKMYTLSTRDLISKYVNMYILVTAYCVEADTMTRV